MTPTTRSVKKHAKARQRRHLKALERLERDRRQAQQAAQALEDVGLPTELVAEIEGRLRSQQKLLSKICGVMFPPLFGCRTNAELCRVRGWDKNLPSRLLGSLPKRSWLKRLRGLGLEVLEPIWCHVAAKSPATQSRWQWTWRQHPWEPRVRYVRLRATSSTYGQVTVVIVDELGQDRFYLLCLETERSAPQLIRRWRRRSWIELVFRTLKHLLATEACQVQSADAYYGHLVLRLMGSFILFYASRVICKGRLTIEEIIFSLKHYWRFIDSEALELQALSWGVDEKAT